MTGPSTLLFAIFSLNILFLMPLWAAQQPSQQQPSAGSSPLPFLPPFPIHDLKYSLSSIPYLSTHNLASQSKIFVDLLHTYTKTTLQLLSPTLSPRDIVSMMTIPDAYQTHHFPEFSPLDVPAPSFDPKTGEDQDPIEILTAIYEKDEIGSALFQLYDLYDHTSELSHRIANEQEPFSQPVTSATQTLPIHNQDKAHSPIELHRQVDEDIETHQDAIYLDDVHHILHPLQRVSPKNGDIYRVMNFSHYFDPFLSQLDHTRHSESHQRAHNKKHDNQQRKDKYLSHWMARENDTINNPISTLIQQQYPDLAISLKSQTPPTSNPSKHFNVLQSNQFYISLILNLTLTPFHYHDDVERNSENFREIDRTLYPNISQQDNIGFLVMLNKLVHDYEERIEESDRYSTASTSEKLVEKRHAQAALNETVENILRKIDGDGTHPKEHSSSTIFNQTTAFNAKIAQQRIEAVLPHLSLAELQHLTSNIILYRFYHVVSTLLHKLASFDPFFVHPHPVSDFYTVHQHRDSKSTPKKPHTDDNQSPTILNPLNNLHQQLKTKVEFDTFSYHYSEHVEFWNKTHVPLHTRPNSTTPPSTPPQELNHELIHQTRRNHSDSKSRSNLAIEPIPPRYLRPFPIYLRLLHTSLFPYQSQLTRLLKFFSTFEQHLHLAQLTLLSPSENNSHNTVLDIVSILNNLSKQLVRVVSILDEFQQTQFIEEYQQLLRFFNLPNRVDHLFHRVSKDLAHFHWDDIDFKHLTSGEHWEERLDSHRTNPDGSPRTLPPTSPQRSRHELEKLKFYELFRVIVGNKLLLTPPIQLPFAHEERPGEESDSALNHSVNSASIGPNGIHFTKSKGTPAATQRKADATALTTTLSQPQPLPSSPILQESQGMTIKSKIILATMACLLVALLYQSVLVPHFGHRDNLIFAIRNCRYPTEGEKGELHCLRLKQIRQKRRKQRCKELGIEYHSDDEADGTGEANALIRLYRQDSRYKDLFDPEDEISLLPTQLDQYKPMDGEFEHHVALTDEQELLLLTAFGKNREQLRLELEASTAKKSAPLGKDGGQYGSLGDEFDKTSTSSKSPQQPPSRLNKKPILMLHENLSNPNSHINRTGSYSPKLLGISPDLSHGLSNHSTSGRTPSSSTTTSSILQKIHSRQGVNPSSGIFGQPSSTPSAIDEKRINLNHQHSQLPSHLLSRTMTLPKEHFTKSLNFQLPMPITLESNAHNLPKSAIEPGFASLMEEGDQNGRHSFQTGDDDDDDDENGTLTTASGPNHSNTSHPNTPSSPQFQSTDSVHSMTSNEQRPSGHSSRHPQFQQLPLQPSQLQQQSSSSKNQPVPATTQTSPPSQLTHFPVPFNEESNNTFSSPFQSNSRVDTTPTLSTSAIRRYRSVSIVGLSQLPAFPSELPNLLPSRPQDRDNHDLYSSYYHPLTHPTSNDVLPPLEIRNEANVNNPVLSRTSSQTVYDEDLSESVGL